MRIQADEFHVDQSGIAGSSLNVPRSELRSAELRYSAAGWGVRIIGWFFGALFWFYLVRACFEQGSQGGLEREAYAALAVLLALWGIPSWIAKTFLRQLLVTTSRTTLVVVGTADRLKAIQGSLSQLLAARA